MATFLKTLVIAGFVVILAIFLMAIGWFITGKSKMTRGACGMIPGKRQDQCGSETGCNLCERNPGKINDSND